MQCLSPFYLRKERTNPTGFASNAVPCGRCAACLERKRSNWSFRLLQEYKQAKRSYFITLTYAENKVSLSKDDFQRFIKRLRKDNIELRYYAVGEYGTHTFRPHYHMLLFIQQDLEITQDYLVNKWSHGLIHIGLVSQASIHYTTKYQINNQRRELKSLWEKIEKPFALMSKGIGKNYLTTSSRYHQDGKRFYVTYEGGIKGSLPRYYRDKLFTKEEISINNYENSLIHEEVQDKYKGESDPFRYDVNVKQAFIEKVNESKKSNAF